MSHPEQVSFVESVKDKFPLHFRDCEVLEIGSRNVNGSVRQFFEGCRYLGIDCCDGEGVDWVGLAHNYRPPRDGFYDTVISCSTFEHDPFLKKTLGVILSKCLRKGGLFVGTWAGSEWQEHGTTRSTGEGLIFGPDPDYYKGVSGEEFRKVASRYLEPLHVEDPQGLDVFAWGSRK